MKQVWIFTVLAAMLLGLSACGNKKKSENIIAERMITVVPQAPIRMQDFSDERDVQWIGKQYHVSIHRHANDSLPKVKDEMGDTYLDNFYQLIIERDNATFFERRFVKADLRPYLARDFQRNGIIDGFRFISAAEGRLQFGLCISYPESDMSAPFILTIGPDASFSIEADDVMDVEETGDTAAI